MTNQQGRPSRFSLFMSELRRRHVWRALIAYAAVGFVLLQTAEIVLPAFDAPDWVLRLLIVLILLGFPIALAGAWVYEVTPQGVRRERAGGADARVTLVARLALLGLTLLTVVFVGWWVVRWTVPVEEVAAGLGVAEPASVNPASGEPGAIHSLAVLPFENYSEDDEQDWFSAGMHEALVAQLSQLTWLRVPSRTSVAGYAGTTKTAPEIGRELRVDAIVEGSVLRAGDRVRITVQLIHARTDRHIWSNSYERDFEDVIELQAEVARAIAEEIEAELSPEEQTQLASAPPADPEALTAYMKGRHEQSKGTPEALKSAVDHYQEAIAEDSTYAPALAGLASAQLLLGLRDSATAADFVTAAMQAATRATVIDPTSPEAREVLAEVRRQAAHLGDSIKLAVLRGLPDSLAPIGLAARLDSPGTSVRVVVPEPSAGEAPRFQWVAPTSELALQIELQRLEAMREGGAVRVAFPAGRVTYLALRLGLAGQTEEAERLLRSLMGRESSQAAAWWALEYLRVARGDIQGAVAVRRERAEATGDEPGLAAAERLERAVREGGPRAYFEWRLERMRERQEAGSEVSHLAYAQTLVGLGRHEEALDQLERAAEAGEPGLSLLAIDPSWDPLRGRARFQELARSLRRTPQVPAVPPAR